MIMNMESVIKDSTGRIFKFDNIKALCIILTVLGHAVNNFTNNKLFFRSVFVGIYTFHMPMFIFIAGLFSKRLDKNSKFDVPKFTFYILLSFALKAFICLVTWVCSGKAQFEWFNEAGIQWFVFTLAVYILISFLMRSISPKIVMLISFVLGSISGYFPFINETLSVSRILVYLPFFFIGYYLTPEKIMKFTSRIEVKIASILVTAVYYFALFTDIKVMYKLRLLFSGVNPFEKVPIDNCGIQYRVLCYIITIIVGIAIIAWVPNKKIFLITEIGNRTLGTYFWHRPVLYALQGFGIIEIMKSFSGKMIGFFCIGFTIVSVLVFSLDIFVKPIKAFQRWIKKWKPVWCYVILSILVLTGIVFTLTRNYL